MIRILTALLAVLGSLLTGAAVAIAGPSDSRAPQPPPLPEASPAVESLGDSITVLGLDLQRRFQDGTGNLVFSPLSIATSLAAVYAGARGETAAQMARALHLPGSPAATHAAFREMRGRLGSEAYRLDPIPRTRLWVQREQPILPAFSELLRANYGAEAVTADFVGQPDSARAAINGWVRRTLETEVPDLIPPDAVDRWTRLYVIGSVYFSELWQRTFSTTAERPFHVAPGIEPAVQTMDVEVEAPLVDAAPCEILALPYQHLPYRPGQTVMLVLLPRDPDGLAELQRTLTADSVRAWLHPERLRPQKLRVFLPVLDFASRCELPQVLQRMGMHQAFAPGADFSGINGARDLCLGYVPHRASIRVEQNGTMATAATAVEIHVAGIVMASPASEQARTFRADHPFLFMIMDLGTGCPIFQGRVVDPRG